MRIQPTGFASLRSARLRLIDARAVSQRDKTARRFKEKDIC